MSSVRLACIFAALLLAACDLSPKLQKPKIDVPAAYKEDVAPPADGSWQLGKPAEQQPRGEWWKAFGDPIIDDLEAQARAASPSVEAAAARVEQAWARANIARGGLLPTLEGGIGPTRAAPSSLEIVGVPGIHIKPVTVWKANAALSYEFDLFGRIRNGYKAASLGAEAQQALYNNVLLTLQSNVALAYLDVRSFQIAQRILTKTVALRQESARILQRQFEEGEVGEVDKARVDAELASAKADLLSFEQNLALAQHALAILVGKPPAAFTLPDGPLPETVPAIPPGLPSTLLERRPDIAAAEKALAAANAQIGVARASFFPRLSLTAAGGFESDELSNLFQWSNRTWLLGSLTGTVLTLPIFEGGRLVAGLALTKAGYREAVANYRGQVLIAFRDVEDNLSAQRLLAEQEAQTAIALEAAQKAAKLLNLRYEEGESSLLEKIDADRTLLTAQEAKLLVRRSRFEAAVNLVRALGGGWDAPAPAAAPSTPAPPPPAPSAQPAGTVH